MIQLVLDTNVFVSALFWTGPPRKILDAWSEQKIQLILSTEIMQEYTRIAYALSRKRNLTEDGHVAVVLETVAIYGKFVSPIILDRAILRISVDSITQYGDT
jgi:putative PIN family toxin of toxin-antitoxin system